MLPVKPILVATDFSGPADVAFAYGRELAIRFRSTLRSGASSAEWGAAAGAGHL